MKGCQKLSKSIIWTGFRSIASFSSAERIVVCCLLCRTMTLLLLLFVLHHRPPQYSSDYEHKGGGIAQGVPTTANNSPPPRPENQPATINPTDKLPRRAAVACRRVIYDNLVLSLTGGT